MKNNFLKFSLATSALLIGISICAETTTPVVVNNISSDSSVSDDINVDMATALSSVYRAATYSSSVNNNSFNTLTNAKSITAYNSGNSNSYNIGLEIRSLNLINTETGHIEAISTNKSTYGILLYTYNNNNETQSFENSGTVTTKSNIMGNTIYANSTATINIVNNESGIISNLNENDEVSGNGNAILAVNNGINIVNNGTILGNISNSNGNVTNNGHIELSATHGQISVNNFVNTGTIKIGLQTDGTLGNTTYSRLSTTDATFNTGSILDVNVTSTSTDTNLLVGNTLTGVVTASNTLTVNDLKIEDNSTLVNFQYELNNNSLDLKVVKEQTVEETLKATESKYINSQSAARAFDKIIDDNNHTEMNSVIAQLNGLATNDEVSKAVESTTPQSTTTTQTASSQISSNISKIAMVRQNPNMSTGMNTGDETVVNDKNLWIKSYGSIGSQGNKDGMNGFDVKSYGIGMGFDSKNKAEQIAGVGLFFTDADVDMNNVSQKTDLKAYSMMMYGSLPVIDNKTNFLYQLGYSIQKTDTRRDVFTGDIATADYTSKMATVDTRLVRDYQLNKDLLLQPLVSATYRNFKSPSYSETGAGALNLDVEKSSASEMIVGLGTLATYKLNSSDKVVGNLNIGYDLRDDKTSIVSSYQGASGVNFETQGIDNGRWSYDIGVGYEKTINAKNSISVNYNFQGEGKDYTNNVISANYMYKF